MPTTAVRPPNLDGANAARRFWHVTLPLLAPDDFFVIVV
jgi:ABC-type sugar transport system permease subunit